MATKKQTVYTSWKDVPLILNTTQLCILLGKNRDTIRKLVNKGEIPFMRIGGHTMFNRDLVIACAAGERGNRDAG